MKKLSRMAISGVILALAMPMTTLAGWEKNDTGWWYTHENGSYTQNAWEQIDGKYYYFDGNGYMLHDTTTPDGYWVGSDGAWAESPNIGSGLNWKKYSDFGISYSVPDTWERKESGDQIYYYTSDGMLMVQKQNPTYLSGYSDEYIQKYLNTFVSGITSSIQNPSVKSQSASRVNGLVVFDVETTGTLKSVNMNMNMKSRFIFAPNNNIGIGMIDYSNGVDSNKYTSEYWAILGSVEVPQSASHSTSGSSTSYASNSSNSSSKSSSSYSTSKKSTKKKTTKKSSSSRSSSEKNDATSKYEKIYNTYKEKIEKSEGDYTDLAELWQEGASKMANVWANNNGKDYKTYSKWAMKLYKVYERKSVKKFGEAVGSDEILASYDELVEESEKEE